jgi:hypothetical protein
MNKKSGESMGKRKVRQVSGSSIGITFTKEDQQVYGIKLGDFIDCRDFVVIKGEKNE